MSVQVTRSNVMELIASGAIRVGTKLTLNDDPCEVVRLDVGDRDQPIKINRPPIWPDLARNDRDLRIVTPFDSDGIDVIRDAVAKAVAASTPAQVLAAASALGLKVEQQTTYVLKGA